MAIRFKKCPWCWATVAAGSDGQLEDHQLLNGKMCPKTPR